MKKILTIMMIIGLLFTACDTNLSPEDHDHDGDGVQDHSSEEHEEEHEEETINVSLTSNIYKQ